MTYVFSSLIAKYTWMGQSILNPKFYLNKKIELTYFHPEMPQALLPENLHQCVVLTSVDVLTQKTPCSSTGRTAWSSSSFVLLPESNTVRHITLNYVTVTRARLAGKPSVTGNNVASVHLY